MTRSRLFAPLLFALCGGCAIRGTVHLAKAEQAILRLEPVEAETWAPYSSTMARQYIIKARSEWAQADYGDAEMLCGQVEEWVDRAVNEAVANKATGRLPDTPPDWVDPVKLNGGPLVSEPANTGLAPADPSPAPASTPPAWGGQ